MHDYTYTYIQNGLDGSATAKIIVSSSVFVAVDVYTFRISLVVLACTIGDQSSCGR